MPELPEVETTARGIQPHVEGHVIEDWVFRETRLRWPVPAHDLRGLTGKTIQQVRRRGKYLLLLCGEHTMILHLGMSGNLRILDAATPPKKHDHVDLVLSGGKVLRLNDARRFGAWLCASTPWQEHPLLARLGPEPVVTPVGLAGCEPFCPERLAQVARSRRSAIKSIIMDSHVVVGVGNIYASEALFRAGIRPTRPGSQISVARYQGLAKSIQSVLAEAIGQGGTTLKDFTNSDGKPGYFAQKLRVYGRPGAPCQRCQTPIRQIVQQNRSTFFCPQCQR